MHSCRISRDRASRASFWHCVRRRCSVSAAILLVGLLPWVEPARAQKVYSLTVSIHKELRGSLTQEGIKEILKNASNLMKHKDEFWTNDCDVKFELEGRVQTFTSAPARINKASDLEAVHRVPADVKVVRKINYCLGQYDKEGYIGCAWRAEGRQKTVIVTTFTAAHHNLWVHEFGHTTCLPHRIENEGLTLMTPCPIKTLNWRINQDECSHFLAGPRLCPLQDPAVACPRPPSPKGTPLERGLRHD